MNGPILWFIAGNVPTNEEFEAAKGFMGKGPMFEFVSLQAIDLNGPIRSNSGVGGLVPEPYENEMKLGGSISPKTEVPTLSIDKISKRIKS